MSDSRNAGFPRGVDDEGSVVSGAPGRQLTAVRKIGIAGLALAVFLAFIWINQLNKATQQAKQPEVALSTGGAFTPPPPQAASPAPVPASLPMPATSPAPSILAPPNHELTPAESPIFAFSGGSGAAEAAAAALPAPAALTTGNPANRPADPPSALANMLKPTVLSGSKAACCRIPT